MVAVKLHWNWIICQFLLDLLPLSASQPCCCHIASPKEVQLPIWYSCLQPPNLPTPNYLVFLSVEKPPVASCHMKNKPSSLPVLTRPSMTKPLLSLQLHFLPLPLHANDSSHTAFLLCPEHFKLIMSGISKITTLGCCWFSRKTPYIMIFTAMIYYSKRLQSKSAQGKVHGVKTGETKHRLTKGPLLGESQYMLHFPSNKWQPMWSVCRGSLLETKYLEFLSGAGHIGTLVSSSVYTNCQLPEAKQMFSVNRITYIVGVSHS